MKKLNLLFIAILFTTILKCYSQVDEGKNLLTKELVEEYAYDFSFNDKKSQGYQLLESLVSNNDYVVLGEYHFSENIQLLCNEILQLGSKYGYSDFICENGRYTTEIVNKLLDENKNIEQTLDKYLNEHSFKYEDDGELKINTPLAFFSTEQEVKVLQKIEALEYRTIGIDQEFCYSTRMFIHELGKTLNTPKVELDALYSILDSLESREYEPGNKLCKNIVNDSSIANYLGSYNDQEWQKLYSTWEKSMKIYFGRQRHSRRINLMRINFIEQMNPRIESLSDLKFIVKLGAIHTTRGLSQFGIYDMGELIEETAKKKKKKSIHITCSNRYYEEDGEVIDEIEGETNSLEYVFDAIGKKDKWTIIDLRRLRADYENNLFTIPEAEYLSYHDIKHYIMNNDIYIITPTDKELIELTK